MGVEVGNGRFGEGEGGLVKLGTLLAQGFSSVCKSVG